MIEDVDRMFHGFARVWTAVTDARRLVSGSPLGVVVAGERVVFFRDRAGRACALIDRCPHRGAQLSLGRVGGDGCIECPFHGWRFASNGENVHVPFNPDAKRHLLGATPLLVREIGGLLWVYCGSASDAPSEPRIPEGLRDESLQRTYIDDEWATHWTRAMENMLDMPHLPFVHRKSIGKRLAKHLTPKSRMDIEWEPTDFGGRIRSRDGVEMGAMLEFWKPNIMVLHIPIPNRHFRIHALCVPASEAKTRMIIVGSRSFAKLWLFNPLFNLSNRRILREDKAVLESSDPPEVPEAAREASVRTDRPTLEFRKYYLSTLRGSSTVAAPFVAPDT